QYQSQHTLANNPAAESDVDLGAPPEHAIEPVKELAEQPVALSLWPEEQSGKRGAQRESVKGRKDHRDGDGDGKLLVKSSGDSGDEGCRYKHRGENQGNGDDGTGKFFHCFPSGIFRSETFLDVTLHSFDDDDGVI